MRTIPKKLDREKPWGTETTPPKKLVRKKPYGTGTVPQKVGQEKTLWNGNCATKSWTIKKAPRRIEIANFGGI